MALSTAEDKTFISIAGLHRPGTFLLHKIISSHPEVSGFSLIGVPEDEGQHLQSVYKSAKTFGGAGTWERLSLWGQSIFS